MASTGSRMRFLERTRYKYHLQLDLYAVIAIVIVIFRLLKRHSKAMRRAPAYSRALNA